MRWTHPLTQCKQLCALLFELAMVFFWSTALACAQAAPKRMSLTEAIEQARRQSPLLAAAKQRVAMAEAEKLEASLRPNPSFNVSGENFPLDPPEGGFQFKRTIDWFATFTHTVEIGNKRALRTAVAERNLASAQIEIAALERQLVYEVKAAYQKVAFERLRMALLQENLTNLEQLVQLTAARVKEGYIAEGDLIKTRLETQRFNYQLRTAAIEYDQAKIKLLRAVGADSFESDALNIELADDLESQPVSYAAATLQEAALRQPQVMLAQSHVEAARAALQLEQARVRPDWQITAGYKRNGLDNALYGALSIPLPIFNKNQGMLARAEGAIAVAESELRYARSLVLADLTAARRALAAREQQLDSIRASFLQQADEARNIALAAYREGATDLIVLLDAQRTRSQAQELYFQALYDYQLAVHELERAAGIDRLPVRPNAIQMSTEK
jgi:cobalt-zinc-cadmium efflux system outer membrane protein